MTDLYTVAVTFQPVQAGKSINGGQSAVVQY
jgi:hypothetical protein